MKKIKTILITLGSVSAIYGFTVVSLLSGNHWFNYAWFILAAFFILLGVFIDKISSFAKRMPRGIKIVVLALIAAVLVHFGAFEAKAIACSTSLPNDDAKWVIVLGAKVNGETPSLEFQKRIDKAIEYAKENPGVKIILTGGMGNDENIPESEAARRAFIAAGIEENRLFKEEKSTSTTENFLFAKEILEKEGKTATEDVIVVSSSFHLYRASLIAQRAGFRSISFLGSVGLKILVPHYFVREYAAYVRELI